MNGAIIYRCTWRAIFSDMDGIYDFLIQDLNGPEAAAGDLVSKENQDGLLVGTRKKVRKLILMIFPINELKETDSYSATAGVNVVSLNSVRDMDLEFGRVFLQYLPVLLLKVLIRRWRGLYPIV